MAVCSSSLPSSSMVIYIVVCGLVLLCGLTEAGNGDLSEVQVDMTAEDYGGEPQKLKCHSCWMTVHGNNCKTMEDFSKVDIQECTEDETFCMVERLYTNNKLITFTRKCSQQCAPGCHSEGESYTMEKCLSCCKDNFCNMYPSDAVSHASSLAILSMLYISALTLLFGRRL